MRVAKSAAEIAKAQEDLKLVTADVEVAQNKLNASYETQNQLKAHLSVADLRDEVANLLPHLDQGQIKIDGVNLAINGVAVCRALFQRANGACCTLFYAIGG